MKRKVLRTRLLPVVLSLTISALSLQTQAQVTIGSGVTPHTDALLDLKEGTEDGVEMSKKGLLLPRVKLISTTTATPLLNHVNGMFVYNTNTTAGVDSVAPGIYYSDGEKWIPLTAPPAWLLGGNAGTDPANNFVGTTDDVPLMFRVNNFPAGFIGYEAAEGNSNAFGLRALSQNTGIQNNAFGEDALADNRGGTGNNAFGYYALRSNQSGSQNNAFGFGALASNGGNGNIALGYNAGNTITTGNSNIMVGNAVQPSSRTANNELNIGNVLYGVNMYETTGKIGVGVNSPAATLDILGDTANVSGQAFKLVDGTQGNGKILTSDANGMGTWQKQWFYLPSFNLDISSTGTKTVNLYQVYAGQFTKASNGKFISSNAELSIVPQYVYAVNQLDFTVTDYDDTVITVTGINPANGEMTYDVLQTDASPDSYINIICVVK